MYFRSKIEIDLMNSKVKINKITPRSGISYLKVNKNPKQQTYYPSYSQFKGTARTYFIIDFIHKLVLQKVNTSGNYFID